MRRENRPLVYVRRAENSHVLKMKWFLLFCGGKICKSRSVCFSVAHQLHTFNLLLIHTLPTRVNIPHCP